MQGFPVATPDACDLRTEAAASQYLSFTLGTEVFALPVTSIREIIESPAITEVPMAPPQLRGIINLRGSVVPVMDLALRFGRPATPIARRTCIVILELPRDGQLHTLGVMVDAVNAVLDSSVLTQAQGVGHGLRADFVAGVLQLGERFVLILDIARCLGDENLAGTATTEDSPAERNLPALASEG